jgi:hypothetical protein
MSMRLYHPIRLPAPCSFVCLFQANLTHLDFMLVTAEMSGVRFACLRYAPVSSSLTTRASGGASGSSSNTPKAGGTRATGGGGGVDKPAPDPTRLYALMNNRNGCWAVEWLQDASTGMLSMGRYRLVGDEPASVMDVSRCGQLITIGTSQSVIYVSCTDWCVASRIVKLALACTQL